LLSPTPLALILFQEGFREEEEDEEEVTTHSTMGFQ
jgi:hypothetical protein